MRQTQGYTAAPPESTEQTHLQSRKHAGGGLSGAPAATRMTKQCQGRGSLLGIQLEKNVS